MQFPCKEVEIGLYALSMQKYALTMPKYELSTPKYALTVSTSYESLMPINALTLPIYYILIKLYKQELDR